MDWLGFIKLYLLFYPNEQFFAALLTPEMCVVSMYDKTNP
jgi:hypothetical protein